MWCGLGWRGDHVNGEVPFLELNAGDEFDAGDAWPGFVLDRLQVDGRGRLLLQGASPAIARRGVFRSNAYRAPDRESWFRLRADAEPLPDGTHLQLFTYAADAGPPPAGTPDDPFAGWRALPRDVLDGLVSADDAVPSPPLLWIGGILASDGGASPAMRQIRLECG